MKKFSFLSLLLFSCIAIFSETYAQADEQKNLSLTIYNTNLGVVRDTREFNLTKGNATINVTDVAQQIDPTSVKIKFEGEVIEQNYQYDLVSLDKILQRYIDKDIQLLGNKGELIEGTLLSVYGNQVVLKKKDAGLLMLPNVSEYRFSVTELPEGLITKPTLQCLFDANKTGKQDVEITYQTGGMDWHAEYVAVLDKNDTHIDLNSWVSIQNNSGVTYKNAGLKLIAGDVNRVQQPIRGRADNADAGMMLEAKAAPQFEEKAFFEYHIYNLQRKTTLANNETKQISLFEKENIKAVKKYVFAADQYGGSKGKVAVMVEFENKESNNLGVPMPKGKVRIYKADGSSLEFIGEDQIDHTPKDEKLSLKIGDAFDILGEEVQTDYKKITDKIYETSYKITVKNRKSEDVTVEVKKALGLLWEVKNTSLAYEKVDAQNIKFKVNVPAGKEESVTYTVRYSY